MPEIRDPRSSAPAELRRFDPDDWPGLTDGQAVMAFRKAADAWLDANPGRVLPLPGIDVGDKLGLMQYHADLEVALRDRRRDRAQASE